MLNSLGGGAAEEMVVLQNKIGYFKSIAEWFWVLATVAVVLSSVFLGVCAQSSDEERSHSPASLSPYVRLQAQTQPVNVSIAQIDPSKFPIIELYALVTDQDGNTISGLTAGNFLVTEQSNLEITKTIETVSVTPVTTTGGIAVALVIDRSGSMSGSKIADAKTAANSFIDNLATLDRAAIISFSSSVTVNQAFTSDKSALQAAVNSLSAYGGTAVYDAIYEAVEEVTGEVGVKAVVIFTDGISGNDIHTIQEAIDLAKARGVPVYTIGLGSSVNEGDLQTIANETGGYYTFAPTASDLQQIYDDIAQSIRDQYLVTYSTHNPNYDGTTRTVEVTATVGANSDSDSTTYSVTQPPQIDLTQDTTNLMSQAQYAGQTLTIGAIITDDVLVTRAKLFYRKSGSGNIYTELEMTSSSDLYTADIPASGVVTPGVDFYVTATDGTLTSSAPRNNPASYPHQIAILPNEAPVIDHTPVTTAAQSTDIPISAEVTDTTDYVDYAKLFYRTTGYVLYDSLDMVSSSDTYTRAIPAAKVTSAGVDYYIMASDNHTVKTYDGTDVSPHHINTANELPVADAGPNQTITDTDGDGQESVTLDGSGSDDPDGTIASWVWTEGGGQIATAETPTITLSVGTHTITLTVTDNDTATDTDEVTIVIASGHTVNSPNEPSGPRSGEADELLEFSTSISRCSKGHPVEYQFNWDSSGEDDLSEWSSSTSASHSYSDEGTYAVKARARCATDILVESGWSAPKTVIIGPPPDEHAPIADASDISGQQETMHPDTPYTVTAKYYDADGRDDLNICYLRLNHPSKRLTMMWYQVDGNYGYYAGEGGERYLTISNVLSTRIPGSPEGYELVWVFKINDSWPEVENAIDFGVFASDDGGLDSGDWHYDNTKASFILEETGTVTGRVTDASIPGPSNGITGAVLLFDPDPFTYSPVTLNQDYFSFSLPAGAYNITASASGYSSLTKSVTVTAGEPTKVNFALSKRGRVPVIIIPGIMGSELFKIRTLPDKRLWPDVVCPHLFTNLDDLRLGTSGQNIPGVSVYASDLLRHYPTECLGWIGDRLLPQYDDLIYYLEDAGYPEGQELFVLPYDWRKDLRIAGVELAWLVNQVISESGASKVDIVAHSMGGLVARYYINSSSNAPGSLFYQSREKVRKLLLVATPSFGSPDAFQALHPELGRGLGPFFSDKKAQELSTNWTGVYQLLPTAEFFQFYTHIFDDRYGPAQPGPLIGSSPVATRDMTYLENADSTLSGVNEYLLKNAAFSAYSFHDSLGERLLFNGETYIIAGSGTPTKLVFTKRDPEPHSGYSTPSSILSVSTWFAQPTNGDGTVPLRSVTELSTDGPLRVFHSSARHSYLPKDRAVKKLILYILTGDNRSVQGIVEERSVQDGSRCDQALALADQSIIIIKSPVELHVYDSEGRHIGPDTNGVVQVTSGRDYFTLGDNTIAFLPMDTTYNIELLATESGAFGLEILETDGATCSRLFSYDDVEVTSQSKALLQYIPGSVDLPPLNVDRDGDGSVDAVVSPKEGNTPLRLAEPVIFMNGSLSISFTEVLSAGHTLCKAFETLDGVDPILKPATPFYWLSTSALFSGSASITIQYDETDVPAGRESHLKLYKITGEDTVEDITLQLDQAANTITGQTDGFSYFVVGYMDESRPIDNVIAGPNPVPDTGTAFFYSLPVGTSMAKLMVLSATTGRLLFETSIDVTQTRFPATGTWDPVDNDGVKLANGPYLYVLIANGQLIGQGKMVIQR